MTRTRASVVLLLALLLVDWVVGAKAILAEKEPLFYGGDLSTREAEVVAREAYRRLEERTTAAGSDLRLELSDFYTLRADELATVSWLDLVTAPGGPMIDVHRGTHSKAFDGLSAERRVEYKASWNDEGEDYLLTEEGRQLLSLTAERVLDRVGQEQPTYRDVQAVTSFEVQAAMQGREVRYRAALLWAPGGPEGTTGLIFADHITQRVQDAALEELAPITPSWLASNPAMPAGIWEGQGPTPTECHPFQDEITVPYRVQRSIGHVVGSHSLSGSFSVDCRCAYDCSSSCEARVRTVDCDDVGLSVSSCHSVGVATDGSDIRGYGGGQSCGAGATCGVSPCFGCLCGVTVRVAVTGGSVSFGGGGTLDTMSRKVEQTCPACEPCT